jgi:hypothetical protein
LSLLILSIFCKVSPDGSHFAYNLKDQPDLLVLLLKPSYQATDIREEMGWLEQLDALGMKTPKRYKQIKFVNKNPLKI